MLCCITTCLNQFFTLKLGLDFLLTTFPVNLSVVALTIVPKVDYNEVQEAALNIRKSVYSKIP